MKLSVLSSLGTREAVQEYYGQTLQKSDDLATNACCTAKAPPLYIRNLLKKLHPTVLQKYYGCGLCLPNYDLTDCHVLDLGCGAGRDVFLASQLVGSQGRVVGVDMTVEQLEVAREFQQYHADQFGYKNTEFVQGYLEDLGSIDELQSESFDLIISNCVINLCTDKPAVLRACFNLLKPGGELYFSDVYANRRVPRELQQNKVLWGECLSGALYWNDFEHMATQAGFIDSRLVEDSVITIENKAVAEEIDSAGLAGLAFHSATYRLMKISALEPDCEDYGQAVIYKGTIEGSTSNWRLDKHHLFEAGHIVPVCGNTWLMLHENPRIQQHFDFIGSFDRHYGLFEGCGKAMPFDAGKGRMEKSSCC